MQNLPDITSVAIHAESKNLQIFLFNVGQGDHILLKFPSGEYGIIDFFYDPATGIKEPPALTYFKHMKVSDPEQFSKVTIAFFCISHTDKDHIKGVAKTLLWFNRNNVYIKDFWLGAARDEAQFFNFLREKVPAVMEQMDPIKKRKLNKRMDLYKDSMSAFFQSFELWRKGKLPAIRYQLEPVGKGEYLCEIRPLRNPSTVIASRALNMGPLGSHVEEYINNLELDQVMYMLNINEGLPPDKNLMSHILRLTYGDTNLLFGGDTNARVWKDCLDKYHDKDFSFIRDYGSCKSPFIKVSHHGSRDSSSPSMWQRILPAHGDPCLGISAGQHKSFGHPHSDTLGHIRAVNKDARIFVTNICSPCVWEDAPAKEWHSWYDDYIVLEKNYFKKHSSDDEEEIKKAFGDMHHTSYVAAPTGNVGLLAYIFEISGKQDDPIRVRTALCSSVKGHPCFYTQHEEKLCQKCYGGHQ